jgi:ATP-binding cassette, subfamily B (MDR/TAP), member 1
MTAANQKNRAFEDVQELDLDRYEVVDLPPGESLVYMNGGFDDSSTGGKGKNKKKGDGKKERTMATIGETFDFVFSCGPRVTAIFCVGVVGGFMNGLVYPALAYIFSTTLSSLSGAASNGISPINRVAYIFLIVGAYALLTGLTQNWAFELVAFHASQNFRKVVSALLARVERARRD